MIRQTRFYSRKMNVGPANRNDKSRNKDQKQTKIQTKRINNSKNNDECDCETLQKTAHVIPLYNYKGLTSEQKAQWDACGCDAKIIGTNMVLHFKLHNKMTLDGSQETLANRNKNKEEEQKNGGLFVGIFISDSPDPNYFALDARNPILEYDDVQDIYIRSRYFQIVLCDKDGNKKNGDGAAVFFDRDAVQMYNTQPPSTLQYSPASNEYFNTIPAQWTVKMEPINFDLLKPIDTGKNNLNRYYFVVDEDDSLKDAGNAVRSSIALSALKQPWTVKLNNVGSSKFALYRHFAYPYSLDWSKAQGWEQLGFPFEPGTTQTLTDDAPFHTLVTFDEQGQMLDGEFFWVHPTKDADPNEEFDVSVEQEQDTWFKKEKVKSYLVISKGLLPPNKEDDSYSCPCYR